MVSLCSIFIEELPYNYFCFEEPGLGVTVLPDLARDPDGSIAFLIPTCLPCCIYGFPIGFLFDAASNFSWRFED